MSHWCPLCLTAEQNTPRCNARLGQLVGRVLWGCSAGQPAAGICHSCPESAILESQSAEAGVGGPGKGNRLSHACFQAKSAAGLLHSGAPQSILMQDL